MKTRLIFIILCLILLAISPVAYVYGIDDSVLGQETVQVQAAEPSEAPSFTAFGRAIGGVTPGDLFFIDATEKMSDIHLTLYFTNTQSLIHYYRYMILKVGIYVESSAGKWQRAAGYDSQPIPDTFITLSNGEVSFTVAGGANYKGTIDGGRFYCITASAESDSLSPQFYLTAD